MSLHEPGPMLPATGHSPAPSRVPARAFVLGALLLTGLLAATPYNDYFVRGSYMANHHVPVAASFVLLVICLLVNPALAQLRRGALSRAELAVVWAMMAVPSGIASAGLMRFLIPTLPAVRYFASPENKWEEVLWPHIPTWLVPTDEQALKWFYDGSPSGGGVPWAAWAGPIVAWSVVALLIWTVLLCLATLLRRQWIENERMTFVHVQLPMALVEDPAPGRRINAFFSDRLMWIGFLVPVVLYGVVGLGNYYPAVPKFSLIYPNFYSRAMRFEGLPWNAAGPVYTAIFPSTVGFGFLLTTEVSLSAWVCYVLFKLEAVFLAAVGFQMRSVTSGYGAKQFTGYQDMGVYVALVGVGVYLARSHLRLAWGAATGRLHPPEAGAYRLAIWVGLGAFLLLLICCSYAGLSALVALAFFAAYFMICTGVSWMTSNTGVLQLPVVFRPEDYLLTAVGTRSLRPRDLTLLVMPSRAFGFYYNEMMMPHFLNQYKLAGETGVPRRALVGAMIGAVLLGLVVAWLAQLVLVHAKGAYALQQMSYIDWAATPFRAAATFITQPQGPALAGFIFMGLGAAAFAGLSFLRAQFVWWPLHPAGLVMGSCMEEMWFSLFVAWACKTLILRYGGARVYQRARMFFLGLVAGEATIASIWIAIGFVTGTGVRMLP